MGRDEPLVVAVGAPRIEGGTWRRSARLRSPDLGERELWFEVDAARASLTTDRADPFVVASLLLALIERRDLVVRGAAVDAGLLRNLDEFQRIWSAWWDYEPVAIDGDAIVERPPPDRVVAFSGGADSAFSAWWHVRGDGGVVPPLRGAMMVRGIDIPLADPRGFAGAAQRARRMTDSLGLEHVVVATNAWELQPPTGHYTGMGVAGALHVLGGGFGAGLIPSTAAYRDLVVPMNSSAVSDWRLGGGAFAIEHDGARYNRFEKLQRLATWPEAMTSLRVCLEDPRHDRNCGTCHKCMMTLAAFRVIGVEPSCFDRAPSAAEIHRWARTCPRNPYSLQEGSVLVRAAEDAGVDEPWVSTLKARIRSARVKDGVRAAFPELAARAAAAHRGANRLRRAVVGRLR